MNVQCLSVQLNYGILPRTGSMPVENGHRTIACPAGGSMLVENVISVATAPSRRDGMWNVMNGVFSKRFNGNHIPSLTGRAGLRALCTVSTDIPSLAGRALSGIMYGIH